MDKAEVKQRFNSNFYICFRYVSDSEIAEKD